MDEDKINKILIEIRKNQIKNKSLNSTKVKHYKKMFKSIKDDDKSNFIEMFMKFDDWLESK